MIRHFLAAALLLAATPTFAADDAAIAEIRSAWTACTDYLAKRTDDWMGWRHIYDGGYADFFEFYDNTGSDRPSVLKLTFLIDAIATEEQTLCYRPDGTLAFVYVEMTSPNMALGFDAPAITRQGRIYVDPAGQVIRTLGKIVGDGFETTLTDENAQLARGCSQLDLRLTTDLAHANYLNAIGDIDGSKPDYEPNLYDWCAVAE